MSNMTSCINTHCSILKYYNKCIQIEDITMNILVLGDSHSGFFRRLNERQTTYLFDVKLVIGASARGVSNLNSKTQSRRLYSEKLAETKGAKKVLIVLGEVDCGYLAYISAKKYNTTIEYQLIESHRNLISFVDDVVIGKYGFTCDQVIISGSFLPAIRDTTFKNSLHGLRPNVDAKQKERTLKTLFFNNMLKTTCKQKGFTYFDITTEAMGDDGTIKDKYLSPNIYDHHLDITKIWGLLLKEFTYACSNPGS